MNESNNNKIIFDGIDNQSNNNTGSTEINANSILGINPTFVTPQNEEIKLNPNAASIEKQVPEAPINETPSNEIKPVLPIMTDEQVSIPEPPKLKIDEVEKNAEQIDASKTLEEKNSTQEPPSPSNKTIDNNTGNQSKEHSITSTSNNDEELLKAYIGNNYEKITTRPFNFAGFFFTSIYMLYRKMFLYGLIVFIINFIILNFVKIEGVWIIFNAIVGLFVNVLYTTCATSEIEKIKNNNKDKSLEELKTICSKAGGTSIGTIFIGFFVEIIISIAIVFGMALLGIVSNYEYILSNFKILNTSQNGTYNGVTYIDSSIKIENEFTISIPDKFTNESNEYEYNYSYYSNKGVFNKCSAHLFAIEGFSDAENLINQMKAFYSDSEPTDISKVSINNITWHDFSITNDFGKSYYYGTTKKNKAYILQYDVNIDTDSDCETYKDQIINSITSK